MKKIFILLSVVLFVGAACGRPAVTDLQSSFRIETDTRPAACGSPTASPQAHIQVTKVPSSILMAGDEFTVDFHCITGTPELIELSYEAHDTEVIGAAKKDGLIIIDPEILVVEDKRKEIQIFAVHAGAYTVKVTATYPDKTQKEASALVIIYPFQLPWDVAIALGPDKKPEKCGERFVSQDSRTPLAVAGHLQTDNFYPVLGESITFDATCSMGDIVKVEWDVDMMECLERKSPGITRRPPATEDAAYQRTLDQGLESCFERAADIDPNGLTRNDIPALILAHMPKREGTTRARIRVTNSKGRRDVKHIVYTVLPRGVRVSTNELKPHLLLNYYSALSRFGDGERPYRDKEIPVPYYPDNRTVDLVWPSDWILALNKQRPADTDYSVYAAAVDAELKAIFGAAPGLPTVYALRAVGKSPKLIGEPVIFEASNRFPVQPSFRTREEVLLWEFSNFHRDAVNIAAPTLNTFSEARNKSYGPLYEFIDIETGRPSRSDLCFEGAFPYEVEVALQVYDRSGRSGAETRKIRFLDPHNHTEFKTQLVFRPMEMVFVNGKLGVGDYSDYLDLKERYTSSNDLVVTKTKTFSIAEERIYAFANNPSSPFVLDPGQEVYLNNYTVFPSTPCPGSSCSTACNADYPFSGSIPPKAYILGAGSVMKEEGPDGGQIATAPVLPGVYNATVQIQIRKDNQQVEDTIAYRVRELIKLNIQSVPTPTSSVKVNDPVIFDAGKSKGEIKSAQWIIRDSDGRVVDMSGTKEWNTDGKFITHRFTEPDIYSIELTVTEAETLRQARKIIEYFVGKDSGSSSDFSSAPEIGIDIAEKGVANVYDQDNLLFGHGALLLITFTNYLPIEAAKVEWDFNDDGIYTDHMCTVAASSRCDTVETQVLGACPNNDACVIRVRILDASGNVLKQGEGSYRVIPPGSPRELTDYEKDLLCPPENERQPGYLYKC